MADLAQASPATVSRCGMVYIDPGELGYIPYVRSWLELNVENGLFTQENSEFLYELFQLLANGLRFVNSKCKVGIPQVRLIYFIFLGRSKVQLPSLGQIYLKMEKILF